MYIVTGIKQQCSMASSSGTLKKTYGHMLGYKLEKVDTLDDLEEGDHVAFPRGMAYKDPTFWHHAVIETLYPETNEMGLIHYYNTSPKTVDASLAIIEALARVSRDRIPLDDDIVFKVIYDDPGECLPKAQVVERARSRLNEGGYNVLTNNCEHFATWCKTDQKRSGQVRPAGIFFGALLGSSSVKGLATGMVELVGSMGMVTGVKEAIETGTKMAGTAVMQTTGHVTLISAILSSSVEAAFTAVECLEAKAMLKKGKITQREFDDIVGKRVAEGVGDITGGIIGILIGIALGAMIGPEAALAGGILGGMSGSWAGRLIGWGLGKAGVAIRDIVAPQSVDYDVTETETESDHEDTTDSITKPQSLFMQYLISLRIFRRNVDSQSLQHSESYSFFSPSYRNDILAVIWESVKIIVMGTSLIFLLTLSITGVVYV